MQTEKEKEICSKEKKNDDKIVIWYIWYIYRPIKEKPKYLIQIRFPPGYILGTPTENDRSIFTLIPLANNNVMALCMTSANARSNACSITQSTHISAKSMIRSVHTKLLPATLSLNSSRAVDSTKTQPRRKTKSRFPAYFILMTPWSKTMRRKSETLAEPWFVFEFVILVTVVQLHF